MKTGARSTSRFRAFTLIEVLVVVAIIALMVSILIPSLSRARDMGKRAVCANHLHQIGIAIVTYSNDHMGTGPFRGWFSYTISETPHEAYGWGGTDRKVLVNYGLLWGKWITKSFEPMYCPANYQDTRDLPLEPGVRGGMKYVWDPQAYWTYGGYTYGLPLARRDELTDKNPKSPNMRGMHPFPREVWRPAFAAWVQSKEQDLGRLPGTLKLPPVCVLVSDWAVGKLPFVHRTGINVLYTDSHVKYIVTKDNLLGSGSIGQYDLWWELSLRP